MMVAASINPQPVAEQAPNTPPNPPSLAPVTAPVNLKFLAGFAGLWVALTIATDLGFQDLAAGIAVLALLSFLITKGEIVAQNINKLV